jgi:hypothetical protein
VTEANRTEDRSYATELMPVEIRVIRRGETFELVVQERALQVSFEITEQQADQLRFLWL